MQPWYTPARHFARQLVADDPTLLKKRDQLANKVVQSLTAVGIFKRGGKKPFDPGTVKKAFVNVQVLIKLSNFRRKFRQNNRLKARIDKRFHETLITTCRR